MGRKEEKRKTKEARQQVRKRGQRNKEEDRAQHLFSIPSAPEDICSSAARRCSSHAPRGYSAQQGSGVIQAAMHIGRPFTEISNNIESFTTDFVNAVARAADVAPHRIRVSSVSPAGQPRRTEDSFAHAQSPQKAVILCAARN